MRQLKFRIWDRQSKQFVDNSAGTHCASRWLIDAFTGRPVDFVVGLEDPEFGSLSEGENYYIQGTKVVKEPQYVIQQFTGVLDTKGKEIYEGDIVTFTVNYDIGSQKFTLPVVFDEEYNCWAFTNGRDMSFPQVSSSAKVVGNIFENPKLLK